MANVSPVERVEKDMSTSVPRPIVEDLRERIQRLEGATGRRRTVLPFGIEAIDRHLPEGGLALGALHEVAGGGHGATAAAAAALSAAESAAQDRRPVPSLVTMHGLFAPLHRPDAPAAAAVD